MACGPPAPSGAWSRRRRLRAQQRQRGRQDFGPSAGFGVFSLNAGYAISKQVKLSLGVDNLFDKAYAEHLNLAGDAGFGFPGHSRVNEPGRSVWARVSVKY